MPAKLERCVAAVMASGKSEEAAYAICNAQLKDSYSGQFRDAAVFDPVLKTAISVRDGVLEYLGAELGMAPPDKLFRVYRSPATIANVAGLMPGLPITDGHVTLDTAPPTGGGSITAAKMVDARDAMAQSTLAILNQLQLSDTLLMAVEAGANELSLGYTADLVPHNEYDFEQRNIVPHHLAAVERGRCGAGCSFLDRKPETPIMKLHKVFTDADGQMSLQQVVEIATAVPEAIKSVDVKDLPKLLPALQAIVEAAKGAMPAEEPVPEEAPPVVDEEAPVVDEEPKPVVDEDPKPEDKKAPFSDAPFIAFVDAAVRKHAVVIEKARQFLPDTYSFADKGTSQIMRDTLATVEKDAFTDEELPLAFKLLKKAAADYRQFGDAGVSAFTNLADKEL